MIENILTWAFGDPEVVPSRENDGTYLIRWYVYKSRTLGGLYIHRFDSSDDLDYLHSHPWKWALSFILYGGYREEFRVGDTVESRVVKPFRLNWITKDTYHRVDLRKRVCWSMFLIGPTIDTWYFWDRKTMARVPARVWLDKKDDAIWQIDRRRC